MSTFKNFINGQFVEAADGQTTAVIDPSTGEVYAQASLSGAADVDTAMKAAGKAFTSWSQTTPSERSLALYRIADAIEARADEIVAAEVKNTVKPIALTCWCLRSGCAVELPHDDGGVEVCAGNCCR